MTRRWHQQLTALGVCKEALTWAKDYATPDEAWAACDRSDWMLWLIGKTCHHDDLHTRRLIALVALAAVPDATILAPCMCWAAGDSRVTQASLDEVCIATYSLTYHCDRITAAETIAVSYAAKATAYAASSRYTPDDATFETEIVHGFVGRENYLDAASLVREYFPECPPLERRAR